MICGENIIVVTATLLCFFLLSSTSSSSSSSSNVNTESGNKTIVSSLPLHIANGTNASFHATDDYDSGNPMHNNSNNDSHHHWTDGIRNHFQGVPTDTFSLLSLLGIFILGASAQVLDRAFLVAIERDWVVIMSESASRLATAEKTDAAGEVFPNGNRLNSEVLQESIMGDAGDNRVEQQNFPCDPATLRQWLTETNVAMKQIDLSCKIAAPAVAGICIPFMVHFGRSGQAKTTVTGYDLRWAAAWVGAINVLALFVEYVCTARIYKLIPALAEAPNEAATEKENTESVRENPIPSIDEGMLEEGEQEEEERDRGGMLCDLVSRQLPYGMRVYFQQPVAWAGVGLALLYMNALTFGNGIMMSYLLYRNLTLETVGILRGISASIGLLGTFVYQFSVQRLSLTSTGMWSITYEFTCLLISFISLYFENDVLAVTLLVTGVCLSRVGLWVFDITVTQMQQEQVPDSVRGVVGGVQQSLNSFCNLMAFAVVGLFPNPKDFHICVSAACLAVGGAVLSFFCGMYRPYLFATKPGYSKELSVPAPSA